MTNADSGALTPPKFIAKWSKAALSERSASQEHFIDLCRLLGQATPAEHDATGAEYAFEKGVAVTGGASKAAKGDYGFADVWWKDKFAWEYKRQGKHKDLADAYRQLCQYREALNNPPLLVVCDIDRTEIHTNFTGAPAEVHTVRLEDLDKPGALDLLRRVFTAPYSFRPDQTAERITQDVAKRFGELAASLAKRGHDPQTVAHFLMKCMFCLFAEDVELLPKGLFKQTLESWQNQPTKLTGVLGSLFDAMRDGGAFGPQPIARFNGGLFADDPPLELTAPEIGVLILAAGQNWASVEPAIFGTLFERSLDPSKRAQIGAHYTSRDDILLIVEPVVMAPLRKRWDEVQADVGNQLERRARAKTPATQRKANNAIAELIQGFMRELAEARILDPACGSGNFLYVAIQQLLYLEKQVITFAAQPEVGLGLFPTVRPTQLLGIELNAYAAELAQVVIWIGYLQWMRDNGFNAPRDPILEPLQTIQCRDAILEWEDDDGNPLAAYEDGAHCRGPALWPPTDFIIGNPPFLGFARFREFGLPDEYIEAMHAAYGLPQKSDLCCYWFERSRMVIESVQRAGSSPSPAPESGASSGRDRGAAEPSSGRDRGAAEPSSGRDRGAAGAGDGPARWGTPRVGLLATQSIRNVSNREVLRRIKTTGDIFMAWSNRPWVIDGAAVRVALIGFDDSSETRRALNNHPAPTINSDLTTGIDIRQAGTLPENRGLSFEGSQKGGPFEVSWETARALLGKTNPIPESNFEVVRPRFNAYAITKRWDGEWIIDFGLS